MKLFTLHTGTWDSHHLTGVFSTKEKVEAYIKKFNIKDSPAINEIEVDPLDSIVNSKEIPYLANCKKKTKVKLQKNGICESFAENNVHFGHGHMYYYLTAKNDEQAIKMTEKMRKRFLDKDWHQPSNAGVQVL